MKPQMSRLGQSCGWTAAIWEQRGGWAPLGTGWGGVYTTIPVGLLILASSSSSHPSSPGSAAILGCSKLKALLVRMSLQCLQNGLKWPVLKMAWSIRRAGGTGAPLGWQQIKGKERGFITSLSLEITQMRQKPSKRNMEETFWRTKTLTKLCWATSSVLGWQQQHLGVDVFLFCELAFASSVRCDLKSDTGRRRKWEQVPRGVFRRRQHWQGFICWWSGSFHVPRVVQADFAGLPVPWAPGLQDTQLDCACYCAVLLWAGV